MVNFLQYNLTLKGFVDYKQIPVRELESPLGPVSLVTDWLILISFETIIKMAKRIL